MARRRIDISPTTAYWSVVVALCVCSVYFAVNVELRQRSWGARKADVDVASGTTVKVTKIIDGDEVSVQHGDNVFVVRILGIKCWDSRVNEPGISEIGAECERALTLAALEEEVEVVYRDFKTDRAGRLLAYLERDGVDIGQQLVADGHAMVFVRYPFDREVDYLSVGKMARTRGTGLWGRPRARERATSLEQQWRTEREKAEASP